MSRFVGVIEASPRLSRLSTWVAGLPLVGRIWLKFLGNPKELVRFIKFAIVGTIGAAVDFAVLNVMKWFFESIGLGVDWNLSLEPHQIQLIVANAISFSAAVLSNFTWNRLWTFPESRERALGSQLVQFSIVNILGLGINTLVLLVMDQYVFQHFVSLRLSYNLAKAFAIGVVLFWNFGINRIWTYRGIE
ncbi:MAG: GtrA family protein [Anaerolineae bacterium]